MSLRVIDIASWQAGISPGAVDCDIVIVKATGGTWYENPYFERWCDEALSAGRLLGIYHYARESEDNPVASAEARYFLDHVRKYAGRFVPVLDWENEALELPQEWAREWLDIVAGETGATPWFYAYASNLNSTDYSLLTKYPLWMASHLTRYEGAGWVDDPRNTWETGDWAEMGMYQYTSTGRVDGYGADLDLSVYYGSREDWARLCGNEAPERVEPMTRRIDCAERAALVHFDMVEDDRNGYSQAPVRWGGDYGEIKTVELPGGAITYPLGSFDCSSSNCKAWQLALVGSPYEGALDDATYTGNMREVFLNSGLFYADRTPARRGDVYLHDGRHTAMCQDGGLGDGPFGYDCLSHFRHNEWGGIEGGEVGDQTGEEALVQPFYESPWLTTLHYNHKADWDEQIVPVVVQHPGEPVNDSDLWYRVHVEDFGWLDPVRDGQVAGTTGMAKRMEAIKITPPEGWEVFVKLHMQDYGWVTYEGIRRGESSGEGSSPTDPIMGTVGENRRIEDIIIGVSKRPAGDTRHLEFCVHQQDVGWKAWTREGNASGTDGMALRLEAIRIRLVD